MANVLALYKKIGETPLECLNCFRRENSEEKTPMTYAGRLDPLAEGLLLALCGEEVKNKEKYLALDKEYEFEVLFGFETDTGDLLGKIQVLGGETSKWEVSPPDIKKFIGKFAQTYPHYSSKTVAGKPLWQIAREGGLAEVEMPKKEVEIYELEFLGEQPISSGDLQNEIIKKIDLVRGDFRQEEIKENWQSQFSKLPVNSYQLFRFRVSCSSGTYVRALAERIGESLGMPACAFSIKRTRVGPYVLN